MRYSYPMRRALSALAEEGPLGFHYLSEFWYGVAVADRHGKVVDELSASDLVSKTEIDSRKKCKRAMKCLLERGDISMQTYVLSASNDPEPWDGEWNSNAIISITPEGKARLVNLPPLRKRAAPARRKPMPNAERNRRRALILLHNETKEMGEEMGLSEESAEQLAASLADQARDLDAEGLMQMREATHERRLTNAREQGLAIARYRKIAELAETEGSQSVMAYLREECGVDC